MNKGNSIFITGIDTNIGKSYATGYIAKMLLSQNKKVITQKFIQTGNVGVSEDIEIHRKIMEMQFDEDKSGLTCPVILSYPASPHLAAQIDNMPIDINKIKNATAILEATYDTVLIEGAGGIMVPITENYTTIDYIKEQGMPVIIVTTPKLGSINHTLLTLNVCQRYNIEIYAIAYNKYSVCDNIISNNTEQYLKSYLANNNFICKWIEIPEINW